MNQNIGRYQVIEPLGQGAMAVVYKAHDPKIDRTLAIKLLRPERCVDEEYRSHFVKESHAVGFLSHPHIVTIYDVGEIENRPYIAMELINGIPLDSFIRQGNKLSLPQILDIGIQLADALHYAHQKGIVHRDIKPGNIIIDPQHLKVKITDFGIAHRDSLEESESTDDELLGSPYYMSPEQVHGDTVDGRADLYSLGVVLYQLISGQRPFKADNIAALFLQIAADAPVPVGQLRPDLPGGLKQIIDRLLKKRPEQRYQSGQELSRALGNVLEDLQEQTQRQNEKRRIPIHLKWSLILVSAVAVTMILIGSYLYNNQYQLMKDQVLNYGSSLIKFIATESAEPVLSEDWASIELFVEDTVQRQDFAYLLIVDHNNIIRGSSVANKVGNSYQQPALSELQTVSGVDVGHFLDTNGQRIIDLSAAIYFQDTEIGRVHLGQSSAPLQTVARQVIYLIAALVLTSMLAVFVATFLLGKTIASSLKSIHRAVRALTQGHYAHRISSDRGDEFGQLYQQFDQMADAIEKEVRTVKITKHE